MFRKTCLRHLQWPSLKFSMAEIEMGHDITVSSPGLCHNYFSVGKYAKYLPMQNPPKCRDFIQLFADQSAVNFE